MRGVGECSNSQTLIQLTLVSAVYTEPNLHQVVSYRMTGSDEWNRAEVVSRGDKVGGKYETWYNVRSLVH